MHAHKITIEDYDQSAELLALDFTTGRLIIRWGTGITSCVSALRWDHIGWLRESVPHGYRVSALAGPAGNSRCHGLGELFGEVGSRSAVTDPLATVVNQLRGKLPRTSIEHLRGCARWLMSMQGKLMHGFDLFETLAYENATPVGGGSEADDLLGALVRLEFIEPHAFDPRPSAIFFGSEAKQASGFARRCGNWPGHRDSFGSTGGAPDPDASAVGAKHWLFQRGERFPELEIKS